MGMVDQSRRLATLVVLPRRWTWLRKVVAHLTADSDVSRDMPRTAPHKALAIAMEAEKPHYYQVPQDEHGWDMWASRVELSLMGRGLAIEAEASAEPGPKYADGFVEGSRYHRAYLEASAEPGALREALDVERLARAITMHSVAQRVNGPDAYLGHKCMGDCAVHIAREYAALSREEATSE